MPAEITFVSDVTTIARRGAGAVRAKAVPNEMSDDLNRTSAHRELLINIEMIRLLVARLAGQDIEPQAPIGTEAARRLDERFGER
ncbi:hypothetical protein Aca07nite_65010 [Actinoplanes capillaceus]|uniref:Uncharacterized protein n=2 Tax=Actinoplanes campanulatus TaxID=113559 RepID=A0ABQ3WSS9_9ACTN|nr:hypothetical protein [Actinoplanes capillaceus]GID49226.1 hypothetical protein Aca07nite_65010 [Actinoplanes capillaceus]